MSRLVLPAAAALAALSSVLSAQVPGAPSLFVPVPSVDRLAVARDAREHAKRPQIVTSSFVTIDRVALRPFENGLATRPVFSLPLQGAVHTLVLDSLERTWRHTIFRGHVDGDGHFVLAMGRDGTSAAAIQVGDESYALEHAGVPGDVHVLYELDHDRMPLHMGCGTDHSHEVAAQGSPAPGLDDPTTPIVDVAVFYTPATTAAAGNRASVESQIALRVALASDSSARSGVNQIIRLVHAAETQYAETGTTTDLARFRRQGDGYMDEVHSARNVYGADLMALIIEQSGQFCGVAYLMTRESTSFRSSAFSVTVRGCLDGDTLTHEMGHNMGCAHDRANAGGAVNSYAYGYRTPDSRFRTIMAYRPGTRAAVWSSPNVIHSGYTMGTATEDNVRSLNAVTDTVSAFTPMTAYRWCEHGGGIPVLGVKPSLSGSGTSNSATRVEVAIGNVWPGRNGALVVGAGGQNLPLFGGVLVPFIFDAIPVTSASPNVVYDASAVRGLPAGSEVFFQAWFIEPWAAQGVSASDAISVIVH